MPYATRKVRNKPCYRVYNRKTKRVFAKCTTKKQANKQMRLLRAIQNNPNFTPRKSRIADKSKYSNQTIE